MPGFVNDLKMMNDPILNKLVVLKALFAFRCVFFYSLDRFDDIEKPFPIIPHKATASFKARSRIADGAPSPSLRRLGGPRGPGGP